MRHKQVYRLLAAATLMVGAAACGDDETEPDAETTADAAAATSAETVAVTAIEEGDAAATTAPAAATTAPAPAPTTVAATTAPAPTTVADGGGGTPGSLSEALAAEIVTDFELEGGPVGDPDEAACWADAIVSGVGEDRLTELGMTVESVGEIEDYDFDDGEIDVVVESLFDCTDVKQTFAEEIASGLGAETVQCLVDGLDDDWLKDVFRLALADADAEPTPEFIEEFTAIAEGCGIDPNA